MRGTAYLYLPKDWLVYPKIELITLLKMTLGRFSYVAVYFFDVFTQQPDYKNTLLYPANVYFCSTSIRSFFFHREWLNKCIVQFYGAYVNTYRIYPRISHTAYKSNCLFKA